MTRARLATCPMLLTLVLLVMTWSSPVLAQTEVKVVNEPSVSVPEPIPQSKMVRFEEIPVTRTSRGSGDRPLGVVNTAGFTHMMISLGGEVQGYGEGGGSLTLRLVPVETFPTKMGAETGVTPFTLEAGSYPVAGHEDFLASEPVRQPIAFETYALFLTTTSSKTIKASVYLYLTQ